MQLGLLQVFTDVINMLPDRESTKENSPRRLLAELKEKLQVCVLCCIALFLDGANWD